VAGSSGLPPPLRLCTAFKLLPVTFFVLIVLINVPHPSSAAVYNNAQTLNFQRLVYLISQQLKKAQAQGGTLTPALANAVFLLRTILKDLEEQLNAPQLLTFAEVPATATPGETF
jgi:hypothetical protein